MRGRLAPSPSGDLHLGHARSFLLAWWQARAQGGEIVLRMEDLDSERCVPGSEESILDDLRWLGIDWDGDVVRQSERLGLYEAALNQLDAAGHLYPCVCTRRELAQAASAPHPHSASQAAADSDLGPYPGTCRDRFENRDAAREATGRAAAWRMRVTPGVHSFQDGIRGAYSEDVASSVGDFPVTRKDGRAAYQLAVVVDDADQGITHVLRGDDLLSSTLRQVQVQQALGLPCPRWFHVPLVLDPEGARLAKRHESFSLRRLRQADWTAADVVYWVASSAGLPGGKRPFAGDWLDAFNLGSLPCSPVSAPVL